MRAFPFHALLEWSKVHGRHTLPWRQYFDLGVKERSYHIWLSEILLQQTQVDRVQGYYNRMLEHFPTIESLADTSYEEFFPYYQGLGYYSRARNMLRTAKIITENYQGVFPNNTKELLKLPGVGPYTVAAIRAFVYDEPVLSFDTNLEKIFSRYYYGDRFHRLTGEEKILLEQNFRDTGISGRAINAACMDFGSLLSLSLSTKPSDEDVWKRIAYEYPFPDCLWFKTRGALELQTKKKKTIFPTKDAHIICVLHRDHAIYYSSDDSVYQPFILPPTEEDPRHYIQAYFRTRYDLELSVRPIHDKYFRNDVPYVVCNAQIQQGKSCFPQYKKENGIFARNR